MKKNLKTIVLAIALLVSATGVFASDILSAVSGKKLAAYSWETFDPSGNSTGSNIPGDEDSFDDCPTTETLRLCAEGKLVSDPNVVIQRFYQD